MKRQLRLSRAEVLGRLRHHAARHGGVSTALLHEHDRIVLRSLLQYFPTFEAARRAARVPAAPPRRPARVRRRDSARWSRVRVIDELRRLVRGGQSTRWADLMQAGRADLVGAAAIYAGGLRRARAAAGAPLPRRRPPVRRWHKASIAAAIQERARRDQTLASSKAPPPLVAAARWHFGSWEAALIAAGVDAQKVRLQRQAYTRDEVVAILRRLAREGKLLRASTLKGIIKLDTVRKLFGSVESALRAAGIPMLPGHPNQKWTRERVIDELRARASRGVVTLTRALHSAVQLYFGGAHAARAAAGLSPLLREPWTRASLVKELRQRARRGESSGALWSACTRLFGSVAAARRTAGVEARRRAGGAWQRWPRERVIARLQAWSAGGGQLRNELYQASRRRFGSLEQACAAAGVPMLEIAWTPDRIRRALRAQPSGALDPAFIAACVRHFGSVTAARSSAAPRSARTWSRAAVLAELQARVSRGLRGVGRLLRDPAVRLFGSTDAALRAARSIAAPGARSKPTGKPARHHRKQGRSDARS